MSLSKRSLKIIGIVGGVALIVIIALLAGGAFERDSDGIYHAEITSLAGGTLTTLDGIQIAFPAGAVNEDSEVTVQKTTHQAEDLGSSNTTTPFGAVWEINVEESSDFKKPALITLPYDDNDLPPDANEDDIVALHLNGDSWVPIIGEVSAEDNLISVYTSHNGFWSIGSWIVDLFIGSEEEREVRALYEKGSSLMEESRWSEAIKAFDRFIAEGPDPIWIARSMGKKGDCYEALCQYDKAIDAWFQTIEYTGYTAGVRYSTGQFGPAYPRDSDIPDPGWDALLKLGSYADYGVNTFHYLFDPPDEGGVEFFKEAHGLSMVDASRYLNPTTVAVSRQLPEEEVQLPGEITEFIDSLVVGPDWNPPESGYEFSDNWFQPEDFIRFVERPSVSVQKIIIPEQYQWAERFIAGLLDTTYFTAKATSVVFGGPLSWLFFAGGYGIEEVLDRFEPPRGEEGLVHILVESAYDMVDKNQLVLQGELEIDPLGVGLLVAKEVVDDAKSELLDKNINTPLDYIHMNTGWPGYAEPGVPMPGGHKCPAFIYVIRMVGTGVDNEFVESQYAFYLKQSSSTYEGTIEEKYPRLFALDGKNTMKRSWSLYWLSQVTASPQRQEEEEREEEEEEEEEEAEAEYTSMIAADGGHTVGLRSDGSVVALGRNDYGQCDVDGWTDIAQIAAGYDHTVGLKSDGTVVCVGYRWGGKECDVGSWTDIVKVDAGGWHTAGVKSGGTAVAVGLNDEGQCDVGGWTDIVEISTSNSHTVGLKSNGTVVAVGENYNGACDVGGWTDIVQVSAGFRYTVGLKTDGTVVAVGENEYGQCGVGGWADIIQVSAGLRHTVGLKTDGAVVAAGESEYGECGVGGWIDIIQVDAGFVHTVGLKGDGTVVAVGANGVGQCDVGGWDLT